MDLVLNNLQRLICHKTKPNQTIHAGTVEEAGDSSYVRFCGFLHVDVPVLADQQRLR